MNQPTEGDKKITGKGKPGAKIVVKDKDGNTIGETTVKDDGTWEVSVPEDKPLKENDKITVEQTEKGKKPNSKETIVKGKDQSAKPEVNQPTEGDKKITGKGKPGAKIVVKDKDGNTIGETTVKDDGTWEVSVPEDKPLKENDKITVEQTEKDKKPNSKETTVKGKGQSAQPEVNQPTEGDKKITGKGQPGAKIVVKDKDGNKVGEAEVNDKGEWEVSVPEDKPLKENDKITVEQTEKGKKPNSKETIVKGKDQSAKPEVNQPTEGDKKITGKGKPGAKIVVKDKDGNTIGETTVKDDGTWEVSVPEDKPLKKDQELIVEQTEKDKKPSEVKVKVKGKETNGGGSTRPSYPDLPDTDDDKPSDDDNKPSDDDKNKEDDKTDAEKNPAVDPEKTPVDDPNHLTDKEKQEVKDKVKKVNPNASDVIVDDKGNVTLVYPDGSMNYIPAYRTVVKKSQPVKIPTKDMEQGPRRDNRGNKLGAKNVKTGVGSVSGLFGILGAAISGLFASKKKEEDK